MPYSVLRCFLPIYFLSIALLVMGFSLSGSLLAQGNEMPDIATLEKNLEEGYSAAMGMQDGEPSKFMMTWGVLSMTATVLANAKAMAAGRSLTREEGMAVYVGLLNRWRKDQPEAGGPDLFRTLTIEDQAVKKEAVVALLDQYPDDLLVVWQAAQQIRFGGESKRATEVLEVFFARNPGNPLRFLILAQDAGTDPKRYHGILAQWAQASPKDPRLVNLWMTSNLPRTELAQTAKLLAQFFPHEGVDDETLSACIAVKRMNVSAFIDQSRICVARIAGDPDTTPGIAKKAITHLAGSAAEVGDWASFQIALDSLDPKARRRALIGATRGLEAPERCSEIVDLLKAANAVKLKETDIDRAPLSQGLRKCPDYLKAQSFLMDLIRETPSDSLYAMIQGWVIRSNVVWRSDLPGGVTRILEERLGTNEESEGLYKSLDLIYQMSDPEGKRFGLLRRWFAKLPEARRFGREPAMDLARGYWGRGQPDLAVKILERELSFSFRNETAELLWELYVNEASEKRGEEYAASLVASGQSSKVAMGYTLGARSALLNHEVEKAESLYWQALGSSRPSEELALELLQVVEWQGDVKRLNATARKVCRETELAKKKALEQTCAANLLTLLGNNEAASLTLSQGGELPTDMESLRGLGRAAHKAGDLALAEKAYTRILEMDPSEVSSWGPLSKFLEKEGRVDDLGDLIARYNREFQAVSISLNRKAGRVFNAAGKPRQAIDYLQEARRALPAGKDGDWNRAWINQELREAYETLGEAIWNEPPKSAVGEHSFVVGERGMELILGDTAEDQRRGITMLEELAKRPDTFAVEILVLVRASGLVGSRDSLLAAELLAEAARLGSDGFSKTREWIGRSDGLKELVAEVVEKLETLAAQEDPAASALLARLHFVGLGGGSSEEMVELAKSAAQKGEALAMRTLYHAYGQGHGVPQDEAEARRWLRLGASAGDSFCMMFYGNSLLQGNAVDQDLKAGFQWLERAASVGNQWAISDLGNFHDEGLYGLPADPETAVVWKRKQAELGFWRAMGWMEYHDFPY